MLLSKSDDVAAGRITTTARRSCRVSTDRFGSSRR